MNDDFDNEMGLPEDELTGDSAMSDPGDLGLGGMDAEDEMESLSLGRPSGGARARRSSSPARPAKRAAAPGARTSAKKKTAPKKTAKKSAKKGAKKAAGKGKKKAAKKPARKAARKGSKKSSRKK
jgi:hypothetical protein